jgi:RNA polymerase sigma-70 factor (ECF subfamily)
LPEQNLESLFKSLLETHEGAVLKVARAYTFTTEDCQDLAQEILLQVWCSLQRFEDRASPATWFYRVALITALGWRRKEHRRQVHQRTLEVETLKAAESNSAQRMVEREQVERLYAAIHQLPKTDAALVLLTWRI